MFSIFLKSTCLLLANLNQKEKRGFIWPKTFDFLTEKHSNFYSEKRGKRCFLKIPIPEFSSFLSQLVYCLPSF